MKRAALVLLALVMVASLTVGCSQPEPAAPAQDQPSEEANGQQDASSEPDVDFSEMIEVRGSDTMVNLGQGWAEAFMNKYPDAMISVTGGGSGTGVAALINGTIDMAQVSRSISEDEIQQGKDNGIDVHEIVGGRDGIAVVVHVDNPVDTLSMGQIKALFTGEITNWSEVGGPDMEVGLYSRDTSSGTYVFFREFVLDEEDYSDDALLMPSTQAIVEGVIQDEGGIGYIGLGYLSDDTKAVSVSMEEGGEAFMPESSEYPVARPLFLYTNGEPTGVLKLYVDFILSSEGQKIVGDVGFIPLF